MTKVLLRSQINENMFRYYAIETILGHYCWLGNGILCKNYTHNRCNEVIVLFAKLQLHAKLVCGAKLSFEMKTIGHAINCGCHLLIAIAVVFLHKAM